VLAYDLVNLNRFTITTSLVPARDTVLGIILGIFAMWLIFDHLWAKTSTESMRKLFVSAFREIGEWELSAESVSAAARSRHLLAESERMNARLDKIRSLADFSVFEPYTKPADEAYLGESIKMLLPQLRCFLLLKAGLLHHQLISEPSEADRLAFTAQKRASRIMLDTAQILEAGDGTHALDPEDLAYVTASLSTSAVRTRTQENAALTVELLLSSSLVSVAEHLRADSLLLVGPRQALPETPRLRPEYSQI
jgi:multidrug resistance protein MdtO